MANALGPISVSAPGNSLTGAVGQNITFSTQYPFHKLDSTKPISFQIITLFMNKDTPAPAAASGFSATNKTLVYSFPHGYSYVPSSWFLVSINNFQTVLGSEGSWLVGNASGVSTANAQINIEVDANNVNFYISKFWLNDGVTQAPSVLGLFISIRSYIFIEDLLGNSVPSHV